LPLARLQGLPVLVVDDNRTNRDILAQALAGWGLRPETAVDGESALVTLLRSREAGRPFPLVFLDSQMPGIDGFELARQIQADVGLASTQMIMLTSGGQRGDAARCREIGIGAYLMKPAAASEVIDAIQSVLGGAVRPGPHRLVTRHALRERRRSLKVLLAEDHPVNQALAIHLLQKRGHTVVAVADGQQALDALTRDSFDLILMDVQMPNVDGLTATAAIREEEQHTGAHVPIVALTAHAMKGDRERCLAAGMDDYVAKPLDAASLFTTIESLVTAGEDDASAGDTPANSSFDRDKALQRTEGDVKLLMTLTRLFLKDSASMMDAVRQSVASHDAEGLARAAHQMKGVLSTLSAEEPAALARDLEMMGRGGDLEGVDVAWERLVASIRRLELNLHAFMDEQQRRNGLSDECDETGAVPP
ncbi:MAG: response regulator, partial [Acidobacteriota bacterium]